jgi:phosphoenolpyruvate phosphomutase
MSPAAQLRQLLNDPEIAFLMEAHDGVSARIAAVEGFEALWASGFALSTTLGLRDSDEASWPELLRVVESMAETVPLPILVDGDTGYGNFNTARRFVRNAERAGAAGVCLEDKVFPKMNSFVGDDHQLAGVDEFCGKLQACRDIQEGSDFCIVARTESLIASRPLREALDRADAYVGAGADAIFIHSRKSIVDEIAEFTAEWGDRAPVVISPTTYSATPASVFRSNGISAVIWANHSMRAAVAAMRRVCRTLRASQQASLVDDDVASLDEVFELMDYGELQRAAERFAPDGQPAGS